LLFPLFICLLVYLSFFSLSFCLLFLGCLSMLFLSIFLSTFILGIISFFLFAFVFLQQVCYFRCYLSFSLSLSYFLLSIDSSFSIHITHYERYIAIEGITCDFRHSFNVPVLFFLQVFLRYVRTFCVCVGVAFCVRLTRVS